MKRWCEGSRFVGWTVCVWNNMADEAADFRRRRLDPGGD